jgi:hypothetical protein
MTHVPDHARRFIYSPPRDELLASVSIMWDLTGTLPWPRRGWSPRCGSCGSTNLQVRYWKFHSFRHDSVSKKHRWRCDVSFKCRACSLVMVFGVPTPREMNAYWGMHVEVTAQEAREGFKPGDDEDGLEDLRSLVGLPWDPPEETDGEPGGTPPPGYDPELTHE